MRGLAHVGEGLRNWLGGLLGEDDGWFMSCVWLLGEGCGWVMGLDGLSGEGDGCV